ncbi:Twinfilin-1 [Echinococcus granulosus]|uniref:Twinfilin n=1 Tax=Echinococcus granulosus TaxID=6210 RepID=A0A068WHP2_ECHGR|nr:Twinfilin-1 [Echinococcus granulosus]CDS17125.1 twinfilin 1 [Echinococcus granulosus]
MAAQSGIAANEKLLSALAKAKLGSIRLVYMQIEDEQIKLRKMIPVKDSWEDEFDRSILPLLDSKTASYILYRLDSKNNLGYEWILLTWIPNETHVWQKTLYASTRATIRRQFGDGYLADDLLCHDEEDISLAGYRKHLISKEAPVPLTHAEEEAKETAAGHVIHASMNDGYSSMGGVAFALTSSSQKSVEKFAAGKVNYLQFQIDIPQECIFVAVSKKDLKPEEIGALTPPNAGSYHLFRFTHEFDGTKCDPIVFVHTIPGYQSSIKERMLYSSCKGNLIDCLSRQYGIDIQSKLEIEDFREFTTPFLMDTFHSKEAAAPLFFSRPKGPAGVLLCAHLHFSLSFMPTLTLILLTRVLTYPLILGNDFCDFDYPNNNILELYNEVSVVAYLEAEGVDSTCLEGAQKNDLSGCAII